jgi:carotenoid cleavage dioxygenase-like enzyme
MAHIFDIADQIANTNKDPNYTAGIKVSSRVEFPKTEVFHGINKPSRIEGDVFDLEVIGEIPIDIDGTFFRVQPDHRFPPVYEDDIHFNGDGNVTAIRIENGHAHFKQRYVKTDRLQYETSAQKALFGRYRNPYTDNEAVKGIIRTAANTNVYFWRGMLLASKEDGPPYAMNPETLETIGRYDFEGQILSPTFTAHPKFDPTTGEMVCFGYEAGGDGNDGSSDIVVYTINAEGVKTEETWYKAPFCGMIHDCGISENYIVLPMTPLKCDLDALYKGGNHWAWDPEEDQLYGIVPRRDGKSEDIIWLRSKNAFHGHVAGCYENADGHIVFDLSIANGNVFFFFPPSDTPAGNVNKRNKLLNETTRWIFDPKTPTNTRVEPAEIINTFSGEFSRIDDRYVTKPYNHFWQAVIDDTHPYDFEKCGSPAGGLFNCLAHFTWDKSVSEIFWAGPTVTFQEPAFIPKDTAIEGDGYIIALLNHLDVLRNDICIFDAREVAKGPLAVIQLPFKLRLGLHGNFVDHKDIP